MHFIISKLWCRRSWRGDIETEWKAFANKEYSIDHAIFEDRDNTILVRKEATSSQCAHSLPVKFFVPKRVEGCKNVTLDYLNEQLVGFTFAESYRDTNPPVQSFHVFPLSVEYC